MKQKSIDDLIEERNEILIQSGDSDIVWQALGIANRHIERIVSGAIHLTLGVRKEIESCLARAMDMHAAMMKEKDR